MAKPKFAVITGACGGIGRSLARTFREAGYRVIGVDRVSADSDMNPDHFIDADLQKTVRDEAHATEIFAEIRSCCGGHGIHALVNNAAVQILGETGTLTRTDWQTTLDVNLLAPFFWIQGLLTELEAAGGCAVNIGSIHARLTKPRFAAYATSKAALAGLTRALAVDLGARIRVNAIEPAAIETPMLRAGFEHAPELFRQLQACHPAGGIGQPEEVARLALALADGELKFLHGACVPLDGGIGGRLHDPD
jgi:NAD(P)-dependent dehydrogenase (short-subunit alcohol dehydrogenase family)